MKVKLLLTWTTTALVLLCACTHSFAQDKQGRPGGERRIEQGNSRAKENKASSTAQNRASRADAVRQITRERTERLRNERTRDDQAKASKARAQQSGAPSGSRSAAVLQRTRQRAANAIKKR